MEALVNENTLNQCPEKPKDDDHEILKEKYLIWHLWLLWLITQNVLFVTKQAMGVE